MSIHFSIFNFATLSPDIADKVSVNTVPILVIIPSLDSVSLTNSVSVEKNLSAVTCVPNSVPVSVEIKLVFPVVICSP